MFMHALRPSWATLYGAPPPKKKAPPFWPWSQKYSTCSCLISHRIPYQLSAPSFVGGGKERTRPIRDNGRSVGPKTFFTFGFARTCCSLPAVHVYTAKSIGQCRPAGQAGRLGATRTGKPDVNKSEGFSWRRDNSQKLFNQATTLFLGTVEDFFYTSNGNTEPDTTLDPWCPFFYLIHNKIGVCIP